MSLDYQSKSDPTRRKRRRNAEFWRATRFLAPYRRLVVTSIVCAFIVGGVLTAGLGTMLPIIKVLVDGYTVQEWVDRVIVEQRLGVTLSDDPDALRIARVKTGGYAYDNAMSVGSTILANGDERPALDALSDPTGGATPAAQVGGVTYLPSAAPPAVPTHLAILHRLSRLVPTNPVAAIATVFGVMALLAIIGNCFRFVQEHWSDKAAIFAVNDIRRKLYDHVLHIPLGYFGLKGTSDVTSRLVQDCQGLQDGFKIILGQSIQEPIKAAFTFGLALWINWQLTLCLVIFAPIMAAVVKKLGKKVRRATRAALANSASMLGQIECTLGGIRVVKAAGAERFERRRYVSIMDQLVAEQLKMSRYEALSTPAMETISLLVVGVILLIASYMVLIAHTLDPSRFLMVMACMVGIGESLRRVSKLNNVLQRSNAAAARIFETLDVPVERPREMARADGRSKAKLALLARDIRFDGITFSYPGSTNIALDNVSLTVPKGRAVAVVGRNGSGKTTLLAMLPRFYDPDAGRVLIDGVDVKTVTLNSLRQQISIVTQDAVIFPGTIHDNIAYGFPLSTREQVIDAAQRAFAHEFILEKPQGYDTVLDGLGGNLSGGQKQRLNIARAILRDAPILVLDEATSQVDAESEHLIQQAIESLMHERTTFVIAHRFSTITSADYVVVMDRGQIVGQGQHEELLRTCETYAQLYERQLFMPSPAGVSDTATSPT
ncbi:MAG: ABC transporter ATP-binding protein [Tepidisphaeraceae bacterium]